MKEGRGKKLGLSKTAKDRAGTKTEMVEWGRRQRFMREQEWLKKEWSEVGVRQRNQE